MRMRRKMIGDMMNGKYNANIVIVFGFAVMVILTVLMYLSNIGDNELSNFTGTTGQVLNEDMKTKNGRLYVIEYSDFKCPFCANAATTLSQLKEKYTENVIFEYRHFPLSIHPGAHEAAQASECARDQDKFWEYHDQLFQKYQIGEDVGNIPVLKTIAGELNLDQGLFDKCLGLREKKKLVESQRNEAQRLGVTATPTFLIGGEKMVGAQPFNVLDEKISSKLKEILK